MKEIEHPNILRLVGVLTMEQPMMMMFEHYSGGVRGFTTHSR